jgi:hypothetical protein
MQHKKIVKILDPDSPYHGMSGYEIDTYTLTDQKTKTERQMVKVIVPSNIKLGVQEDDQKWIGFERRFIG